MTVAAPDPMRGFSIDAAEAWWVQCDLCEESTLVFGAGAATEAATWATTHLREDHPNGTR